MATMSGAEFDQLPYEERRKWELIQGELIPRPEWLPCTPPEEVSTPERQLIVASLIASLHSFLHRGPGGAALPDQEFLIGESDRIRPDIAVLLAERWSAVDRDKTPVPLAADIAVEVISSSDLMNDTLSKTCAYLAARVNEVWQVFPKIPTVLIYRGAKSITVLEIDDSLRTPLLPGWEIPLREIFEA